MSVGGGEVRAEGDDRAGDRAGAPFVVVAGDPHRERAGRDRGGGGGRHGERALAAPCARLTPEPQHALTGPDPPSVPLRAARIAGARAAGTLVDLVLPAVT